MHCQIYSIKAHFWHHDESIELKDSKSLMEFLKLNSLTKTDLQLPNGKHPINRES